MEVVDIVIISWAKNKSFEKMTNECIKSLVESEKDIMFNIVVIETNKKVFYQNAITYHLNTPLFNYNKACNAGYDFCITEHIGFFNNDVIFESGWCSELLKHNLDSVSPICTKTKTQNKYLKYTEPIFGYRIANQLSGWAIFMKRSVYETINGFDTDISFWASDDAYAQQLQANNIKHYLIPTSKVIHLNGGSNTLNTLNTDERIQLTYEQARIYNKKYNKNLFNLN